MKLLQAFVQAVWTICKKDLRVLLRHPSNVAITVLPALALLFVDALSAGAVGRSPVVLVTLDQGARERRDPRRGAGPVPEPGCGRRPDHSRQFHESRRRSCARPHRGADQQPQYRFHQRHPPRRPGCHHAVLPAAGGKSPIQVTLAEQNLRRQDIQLFQYSAMPLLVLLLVVSGLVSSSLAAAGEWETRTIKELLLSPASSAAIITGKVFTGFVTTTALGILVLGVGTLLGWVQPAGVYWLPVLLIVALVALFSAGLGWL